MKQQKFDNVWDAIEDDPAMAANLTMRSALLLAIGKRVQSWEITQSEAGRRLGLTQPRLNQLLRGRINSFSLDALVTIADRAGLRLKLGIARAA